jgi:GNAT superfamily N-acetyltransferase/catechol 2,3-dioxygenase-like lactoylglutathione lyase family enzyme
MESLVEIREATAADIARATDLLREQLGGHHIDLSEDAAERCVRGLLARPEAGRVLVATDAGETIGIAILTFLWTVEHGGAATWLDELYVVPERRGHGIGQRLVDEVVRIAQAEGCHAVDLEVESGHEEVERLYERSGFRRHKRSRWYKPIPPPAPGTGFVPSLRESAASGPRPFASLDHLSLGVNDLERSRAFYDAALAPLGLVAHLQIPGEVAYGPPDESPEEGFAFYIGFEDPSAKRSVAPSAGFHIALRAPTRASVRAFYAAGLANGGRDHGAPGLRPQYHEHYYGGFLLDPDGHHVEAVCHAAEPEESRKPPPSRSSRIAAQTRHR